VLIFRIRIGNGNPALALLIIVLGAISAIAMGMFLAQVFFYTYTGKGSSGQVVIFVNTFVNVFTGATFPVEVLQSWLRWISSALPQTHAIRGVRLVLSGRPISDPVVLGDLLFLIAFSFIMIPLGIWLMRKGLDRMRREGYSPQPRVANIQLFG
jgi:ABC-type polysaccharide/polyol phosphate export permease